VADIYFYDVPLYQKTINKIYSLIDNAEVQLGEKFPPERELAARWGISRNSLRDAFHILEHRGIIVSKQGRGRFLRSKSETDAIMSKTSFQFDNISKNLEKCSLYDIYCVRRLLEPKAVEWVTIEASDEEIGKIEEGYERFVRIFEQSGKTREELDIHRLYADTCKNAFLSDMIEYALQSVEDLMVYRFAEYYGRHTVEECSQAHGLIIDYMKKRDAEAASHAMFDHLQHTIDML